MKDGTIKFGEIPNNDKLEIVMGKNIKSSFPFHLHNSISIGLVCTGKAKLRFNKDSIILNAGDFFIINSNTPHSIGPLNKTLGYSYLVFSIGMKLINDLDSISNPNLDYAWAIKRNPGLFDATLKIYHSIAEDNISVTNADILLLISEIINSPIMIEDKNFLKISQEAIIKAKEAIKENCEKNLSLTELSETAYLSPFHFLRMFKGTIGLTPYDYQIQCKIKKAMALLSQGYRIVDTAQILGFTDQSHFTRFFKRMVGITPGNYIKNHFTL